MTIHTICQYDTEPPIDEILKDGDGNPIDLSSAQGVYVHAGKTGLTPIIKRAGIIVDPTTGGQDVGSPDRGHVMFRFDTDGATGETAVRGVYIRQWRVDWGGGRDERIPNGNDPDLLMITKAVTTDDA